MYVEAKIYLEFGNVYAAENFCIIYLDMMHNIICEIQYRDVLSGFIFRSQAYLELGLLRHLCGFV